MTENRDLISFQELWHIQVPDLRFVEFTSNYTNFLTYGNDSQLRMFNISGQELWHRNPGYPLNNISIADTLEILAVDSDKFTLLFGIDGATLWRKRPFPAQFGRISANGNFLAFITSDLAIIGTDKNLRNKWSYRRLMKRPMLLEIANNIETTVFPYSDEYGDGVVAIAPNGHPYDAFMGISTITSISLSSDGSIALVLASSSEVYCINTLKTTGIWKGIFSDISGVSLASKSGDALLYSKNGHLIKLNKDGRIVWEHNLKNHLIKAEITANGTGILYANESGEIGYMLQKVKDESNSLTFMETSVKALSGKIIGHFSKVWDVELLASKEHQAKVSIWKGQDGVEYCIAWDGAEKLFCINDLGEEIWSNRLRMIEVIDLVASGNADIAIVLTSSGLLCFDLSGNELFKILGTFKRAHVFSDSAMLFLETDGKCKYYSAPKHYSHTLDIKSTIVNFTIVKDKLMIHSEKALYMVNSLGIIEKQINSEQVITYASLSSNFEYILHGTANGQIIIYNIELEEVFSYHVSASVSLIEYNSRLGAIFIATEGEEIIILNRKTGDLMKTILTGKPAFITIHELGAIIGTNLDQLGLINERGQILMRYTSPYSLKKIMPSHRKMSMIMLSDESLSCIAALVSS